MEDHNGINYNRIKDRGMDELIGICKGILFDGSISTGEAEDLYTWLTANPIIAQVWFGCDLYEKLISSLKDGVHKLDEEAALLTMLEDLIGGREINLNGNNAASTTLPLCPSPPTNIIINGSHIALTGNFSLGKRKEVEALIIDKGGKIKKNANSDCNYLVIGEIGSSSWQHSSFGREIEEAVKTRDNGGVISIISEEHFFMHLAVT